MKMKKQWMTIATTTVLGSTLIAGCGGQTNSTSPATTTNASKLDNNQPVTISFLEAMGGPQATALKKLTDEFQSKNPNVHVTLIPTNNYTVQKQKLTAAIAAHNEPTIAQVQLTWETEYYNNGLLQPLDQLISPDTISDLLPIFKDDNSYDGKLVSVPFNKSDYVLYYNTDAFAKAGIQNPPTTWEELEADAKKLTTPDMKGFGMQASYYTFEMLLNQAGGKPLTPDLKQAAFGDEAGKKALGFMHKLAVEDKVATVIGANEYLSEPFGTGKFAMCLDTVASSAFIKPLKNWKEAPMPGDVKKAVPTAGTNLVLFKSAKPAEQQAAVKYMEFLISKDSTIEWAKATGYLPVRQSALKDPAWKSYVESNPNYGVGASELQDAYFSPRIAALFSGINDASTIIGNSLTGSASVDDSLKKMVDTINKAIAGK